MDDTTIFEAFDNVANNYTGASQISESSLAKDWLSQFLGNDNYKNSTNDTMKMVAYLMDTDLWSQYYAGLDAKYAIGGPTIELFCASYKDIHPENYIECIAMTYYEIDGYGLKTKNGSSFSTMIGQNEQWSGDAEDSGTFENALDSEYNQIYSKSMDSNFKGTAIASPSCFTTSTTDILQSIPQVIFGGTQILGIPVTPAARPIVCLNSNVKLEEINDETLLIVK